MQRTLKHHAMKATTSNQILPPIDMLDMINKSQAKTAVVMDNMHLKKIVTYSLLVSFFLILICLLLMMTGCIPSKWESQAILASLELILVYTINPLVKHFFSEPLRSERKPGVKSRLIIYTTT